MTTPTETHSLGVELFFISLGIYLQLNSIKITNFVTSKEKENDKGEDETPKS